MSLPGYSSKVEDTDDAAVMERCWAGLWLWVPCQYSAEALMAEGTINSQCWTLKAKIGFGVSLSHGHWQEKHRMHARNALQGYFLNMYKKVCTAFFQELFRISHVLEWYILALLCLITSSIWCSVVVEDVLLYYMSSASDSIIFVLLHVHVFKINVQLSKVSSFVL